MKITSQIERSPELKSITLELNPREALVLAIFCGSFNLDKIEKILHETPYLIDPPFDCIEKIKGRSEVGDSEFITDIYSDIKNQLIKFIQTK